MRELVLARRAGVLAVAAVAGALVATPALADVAVSPGTAVQGDGADFDFKVTNTGDKPIGTVTLTLPTDSPVAEAYPLSNDNWAPKITTKNITEALPSIHTGIPESQVTSAITWIAMPGLALPPGKSADLRISLGPMPTLSSYKFTLTAKYTDGSAGPAMTPAGVTLTPATAQQQAVIDAAHAGHGATGGDTSATDPNADENAQFAKVVGDATRGPSVLSIVGWIVAGAALLGGVGLMFRSRHRAEEDDEPSDEEDVTTAAPSPTASAEVTASAEEKDDEAKQPVTAGKWSLKE